MTGKRLLRRTHARMTDLKIYLFGGLEITGAATAPLTRKAKAVAAFLALQHGQPPSRERVAAIFWETSPEEQARTNLRQCLSTLRKHFGNALIAEQDRIAFDPALVETDVEEFEELIGADCVEALAKAVVIYKGDLLDGFSIKEDAFEAWLRPERERLRGLAVNGLIKSIGHYQASQNMSAVTEATGRLLMLDPLNEEAHRTLMRAFAAQGRHGAALKQFEICRDTLRRELGVEPAKESVALYDEVRQQRTRFPEAASEKASSSSTEEATLQEKPSIVVLAFTNLSGDPNQEYFSDGITEDIITELSRFSSLFVIARNSSFAYKGKSVDVRQIARELGVRYLLEGSIRRAETRVRVTAQLVDSVTGGHVWAERFDREIEDIFDLQEEVTRNVVASIAPQIEMAEIERLREAQSKNFTAYDLALKAKAILYDGIRSSDANRTEQAIRTADEALAVDSRNMQALWCQGLAYHMLCVWTSGADLKEKTNRALSVVDRLFDIDASNADSCLIRGAIDWDRGEHDLGLGHLRRGCTLNPNSAWCLIALAWCESLAGLSSEARKHAELGLRLSPRDMDFWLGTAYLALAQANFAEKEFEKARDMGKRALEINSVGPIRRSIVIASCGHLGETKEAARWLQQLERFAPEFVAELLSGENKLYRIPQHNALLLQGFKKALAAR